MRLPPSSLLHITVYCCFVLFSHCFVLLLLFLFLSMWLLCLYHLIYLWHSTFRPLLLIFWPNKSLRRKSAPEKLRCSRSRQIMMIRILWRHRQLCEHTCRTCTDTFLAHVINVCLLLLCCCLLLWFHCCLLLWFRCCVVVVVLLLWFRWFLLCRVVVLVLWLFVDSSLLLSSSRRCCCPVVVVLLCRLLYCCVGCCCCRVVSLLIVVVALLQLWCCCCRCRVISLLIVVSCCFGLLFLSICCCRRFCVVGLPVVVEHRYTPATFHTRANSSVYSTRHLSSAFSVLSSPEDMKNVWKTDAFQ